VVFTSHTKRQTFSVMNTKMLTHKQSVLHRYNLPDTGHSIPELARVTGIPEATLQEVYNRGVGAYHTNPSSVRLKGSYVKGVSAPMRFKLSKQQWAMARVYSFIDENPKHDNDLRCPYCPRRNM
jgi:hypothetical protein